MRTERQPFSWALFVAVAAAALLAGYAIGSRPSDVGRYQEMEDWNGSRAQAEDAMRRWAPKGAGGGTSQQKMEQVRKAWSPRLMAFPTKNCIQLEPSGVGGAPIYCYRANSLDLLEEYSDVE